jgi:hypothetical protein
MKPRSPGRLARAIGSVAPVAAAIASLICLVMTSRVEASDFGAYQYLSPSPGGQYVSPMNNVVFREGRALDPASLTPGLVSVVGAVSGTHDGSLVVARDGRTLVFRPSIPFALGETVHVALQSGLRATDGSALPPLEFTFEVGSVYPRDQLPILAQLEEYGGGGTGTAPEPTGTEAACTDPPTGFPPYSVLAYNNPDPGYLFVSPITGRTGNIAIIDNLGQPLFYRRFSSAIHDFGAKPNGLLTYFETAPATGHPKYFALDHTFALVDSFETGNGYVPDTHDLLFLPNGNFILMAYDPQPVRMDLVVPGGDPEAIVTGLIIQELDPDRNVVFQWRSWDHFQITDFASGTGSLTASNIDYVHGNSVDVMPDGNLLLSSRHMSEVTKIDRQTGDLIWRMGAHAKNNQFTFVNDPRGFSHQHDVRWLPNGHMTAFDNGNFLTPAYSRMVEYAVDEVNKVATLVMEYVHTPPIVTGFLGSVRRSSSGKTLIGWGGAVNVTKLTEINPDGSTALELGGTASILSYRSLRSPWRGELLVTDETLDCGVANPGQTVVRQLRVRNGSTSDISIDCVVSSDPQFAVTTPLPLTLSAGGEAMLDVSFTPATVGKKSGKIYLRVPGATQFVAQDVYVSGVGNAPPDCSQACATPHSLWPPNHNLVPISIHGVVDPDGDPITITVTGIQQSEPLDGKGDGSTCPDGVIVCGAAQVRAERSGQGNGRVYRISFRAEDSHGAACTGTVTVVVPHDHSTAPSEALSAKSDTRYQPLPPSAPPNALEFIDALGPCPQCLDAESNTDFLSSQPAAVAWTTSLRNLGASGNRASVEYTLAADGEARLGVFDVSGREVSTLLHGLQTAGPHQLEWNTSGLSMGIYFYRLRLGGTSVSRVVSIIR